MKIQSLLVVSIICFFCTSVMAEEAAVITGICKDGSEYSGKSKRGACRGHGGVKEWFAEKQAPAAQTAPVQQPISQQEATRQLPASTAATGICKDGTEYTGKSKRGACPGHGGVKEWFAEKQAPVTQTAPVQQPITQQEAGRQVPEPSQAPAPITQQPISQQEATRQVPATSQPSSPATQQEAVRQLPASSQVAAPVAQSNTQQTAVKPPAGSGKVWVNTRSKIYHCEGSKFFGHTKEGDYMSETDAQAKGFVANRKKVCNK